MGKMTPFTYGGFYDVPRYLSFRYRGRWFLLQSPFDEDLDEYPMDYSVYIAPEMADDSWPEGSPEFLSSTAMTFVGQIAIDQVTFDPSKRKELDASCLDRLVAGQELD